MYFWDTNIRKGGRVVECGGLENRWSLFVAREFESPPFRMYFAYILKSKKDNSHYYGHTKNLNKRLSLHNKGKVRYTKGHLPYEIIYFEEYETRAEASKRELFFKSIDGYNWLKEKGIT